MSRAMFIKLAASLIVLPMLLAAADQWQDVFNVPPENFSSTGRNAYFILEPGYQMVYEDAAKTQKLIVTVLDETKTIDGVLTRVVEERESKDGVIAEISRNYFAFDKSTGDAYYFGEDVDEYENGKVAGHAGSWLAGKNGARFGMFLPAHPKIDQKFYQEQAPAVAMDRVHIVSLDQTVTVPAGTFKNCLKTEETSPLEPDAHESKLYAPGVGLLVDAEFSLIKYGQKSR